MLLCYLQIFVPALHSVGCVGLISFHPDNFSSPFVLPILNTLILLYSYKSNHPFSKSNFTIFASSNSLSSLEIL